MRKNRQTDMTKLNCSERRNLEWSVAGFTSVSCKVVIQGLTDAG
jgi:hypothetical protein